MLDKYLNNTYLFSGFQKQDATSSAIQFIGTLQNSYKVCVLGNITGYEYTDVYSQYVKLLTADIDQLTDFYSSTVTPLVTKYQNGNPAEKAVYNLVMDTAVWEKLIYDPASPGAGIIMKDVKVVNTLSSLEFPGLAFAPPSIKIKDDILKIISKLRNYEEAVNLLARVPRVMLNNRNITKPVIMTIGYNAGESACVEGIYEYIYDELCALGEPTINKYQLERLSTLVYRLLHPHIQQNLQEVIRFSHY